MKEKKPIKMIRIEFDDFFEDLKKQHGGEIQYPDDLKLINIRGCNGAGKSTVPIQFLSDDKGSFILTVNGKDKATVFPNHGVVVMGTYRNATGGLDKYKTNDETFEMLEKLHKLPYDIIMEGIMASTIYTTYANLFQEYSERTDPKREIIILNLLPPFEVCLERIKKRSPEKFHKIKQEQVLSKWKTVQRNAEKFKNDGFKSIVVDNSKVPLKKTLDWFYGIIKNTG